MIYRAHIWGGTRGLAALGKDVSGVWTCARAGARAWHLIRIGPPHGAAGFHLDEGHGLILIKVKLVVIDYGWESQMRVEANS